MTYENDLGASLTLATVDNRNCYLLKESKPSTLTLLWFLDDNSQLTIDHVHYTPKKNDVICLTEFHQIDTTLVSQVNMVRFNRDFYCILDHDSDVSCKGMLFFGASQTPHFNIDKGNLETFQTVWKMFVLEMQSKDHLQLEMLQMMLKRILILCARLYKEQHDFEGIPTNQVDLIREFNFLVEQHYKEKHSVQAYAKLMFKSPKTISNIFSKIGNKTPLQFIQDRRMLEAKRVLSSSSAAVSDIAFDLGFEDIQSFSRFFKRLAGISPSAFRIQAEEGKIANS